MIAQTIAHYRVQEKIGAGGMGEVYRATDLRLGRDVALKILPDAFAHDATRMGRFEREAKILASLNHPNIASIYGLEESNGIRALAMELVEGVTLAERIHTGAISMDEALPIAKQMCDALEYAHERGIIHRDLKPSNVKLTQDGAVKVLDFGLAKALEGEATADISNSPTLSQIATQVGILLGTAAYMAPEQARGKRVDRRADIWAFGVVIYEMLAGKPLFSGETTSDMLADVIKSEPNWSNLPGNLPRRILEILKRCLQKDPRRRLQAIGDARIVLEEVLSGASQETTAFPFPAKAALPVWRQAMPWAAGIFLAIIVGISVWELRPRPDPPPVVQFSFGAAAGDLLTLRFGNAQLAFSPDSRAVVFMARHSGTSQLYLRRLDQLEATPLRGTDDGLYPFFSPDGQWIAFFASGKLKKVSVLGGSPVTLCDASSNNRGGTWTPDNSIILAPSPASALMRVSAAGGTPQPFTKLDSSKGERSQRWPQALPGGKAVLFNDQEPTANQFDQPIRLALLKTAEVRTLAIKGTNARYVPGYLLFTRGETLFAVPFDLQKLEVAGSPFPAGEVSMSPIGAASYSVSEAGSLVYVPPGASIAKLAWVGAKGTTEIPGLPAKNYFNRLQLSPDGKRIVVVILEGGFRHIWVYDILRGSLTRLTFGETDNWSPTWSPDGSRIAFGRLTGNRSILVKPADGSGSEEALLSAQENGFALTPTSWSPDGKFLAYSQIASSGKWESGILPLEGERKAQLLLADSQYEQSFPVFSPDGKYLAYVSNESGRSGIYVIPFGHGSGKWLISAGGGANPATNPVWARNGKQLFYREGGNIMGVDVATQPVFSASTPRVFVPAAETAPLSMGLDSFDVSLDGQRFLVHQQSSDVGRSLQINVVLNWSEQLRRLAPAGSRP